MLYLILLLIALMFYRFAFYFAHIVEEYIKAYLYIDKDDE